MRVTIQNKNGDSVGQVRIKTQNILNGSGGIMENTYTLFILLQIAMKKLNE